MLTVIACVLFSIYGVEGVSWFTLLVTLFQDLAVIQKLTTKVDYYFED